MHDRRLGDFLLILIGDEKQRVSRIQKERRYNYSMFTRLIKKKVREKKRSLMVVVINPGSFHLWCFRKPYQFRDITLKVRVGRVVVVVVVVKEGVKGCREVKRGTTSLILWFLESFLRSRPTGEGRGWWGWRPQIHPRQGARISKPLFITTRKPSHTPPTLIQRHARVIRRCRLRADRICI